MHSRNLNPQTLTVDSMVSTANIVFERELNKDIDYIIDHEEELEEERAKRRAVVGDTAHGTTETMVPKKREARSDKSPLPLKRTDSEIFQEELIWDMLNTHG